MCVNLVSFWTFIPTPYIKEFIKGQRGSFKKVFNFPSSQNLYTSVDII